jgi:hypothetical protein
LQDEFDSMYLQHKPPPPKHNPVVGCLLQQGRKCRSPGALLQCLFSFVPILQWLPAYRWRDNLLNDCIGGLTVGIMQMPQGTLNSLTYV